MFFNFKNSSLQPFRQQADLPFQFTCLLHLIAGCILAELYTGQPLLAGQDEADQLACITEMFGTPNKKFLASCKRQKSFFTSKGLPRYCVELTGSEGNDELSSSCSRKGILRGPPLSKDFVRSIRNCPDKLMVDYLRRCLAINPDERMTPAQAMSHEWLSNQSLNTGSER